MCQISNDLQNLRRPGLLVDAASHGVENYERRRDLRRMLRVAIPPTARLALEKLIPIEADLEKRRKTKAATYSLSRHVDILVALLAEARAFKQAKA